MTSFNKAISGLISVEEAFFGTEFSGYMANDHRLKGQNAAEQFTTLSNILDFAEFSSEVSANRKAIFLNSLFWLKSNLSSLACTPEQRYLFLTKLAKAWEFSKIGVPLPIRN
jgi:hypothetical protein